MTKRFRAAVALSLMLSLTAAPINAEVNCARGGGLGNLGTLVNGVRVIQVHVPSGLPDSLATAFANAIAAWNSHTSGSVPTRVRFEAVSGVGHIGFADDSAGLAASGWLCADGAVGGFVRYDGNYLLTLPSDPNAAWPGDSSVTVGEVLTFLFTHELGHVLNLAQAPGEESIMAGLGNASTCAQALTSNRPSTTTIRPGDAAKAGECSNRGDPIPGGDGGGGAGITSAEQDPYTQCWDVWLTTTWYQQNSDGSWSAVAVYRDYLYTTCGDYPLDD